MDWQCKNWDLEDQLYYPKRRVNNKMSRKIKHIIGGFYSQKMNRTVEYESLSERLFYYYLELDPLTIRYYVQPVEVPVSFQTSTGELKNWNHIPDVLVFRQDSNPLLFQVKYDPGQTSAAFERNNNACKSYAEKYDWDYQVIYPSQLPRSLSRNIRFLKSYLAPRNYYKDWIPLVRYRLECLKKSTISDLADSFRYQMDPLALLPLIYYLVAHGVFHVNVKQEIGRDSEVSINTVASDYFKFLGESGDNVAQSN
ncbi:TnsA endonuclease C-terminal domain-containing protein [Cytobacillus gottheilii]|uniref:TnsA endonuclease C-terminal domain-containing protein n=1 Tax=Cytobacillus gottheilii TaxID=859144 RepID=UPI002494C3C8|nr:TnsA endonuclease C-terminal domain-containing protein [Cytobacillus gottheilii]